MQESELLYSRELPGGGHVTIERTPPEGTAVFARIAVERRGDRIRRDGHEPPVIAEATGATAADVFRQLYEIASDNVAIARGLIQWQARRR
ncbi:MAG: hypothetical protein M3081_19560 [Gemmatimonadota bacterium]|nr:hypothetical protein [Gemmatimonadota bacterium]